MLSDLLRNLVVMSAGVGSDIDEIRSAQRRIVTQQVSLARAELAGLHKRPDRDACPHDEGSPPLMSGRLSMPGKASPRSRTTHCSTLAFSAGLSCKRRCLIEWSALIDSFLHDALRARLLYCTIAGNQKPTSNRFEEGV